MSSLNPENTIQSSSSMAATVEAIRLWTMGRSSTCIIVASEGSGKSHLLNAAGREVVDAAVMPAVGVDCSVFLSLLRETSKRSVIVDDLDKVSKGLREQVLELVQKKHHLLLASVTGLAERTKNVLFAKDPEVVIIQLDDPAFRPEDIEAFVKRWFLLNGITCDQFVIHECATFCCASRLTQGLRTVDQILENLAGSGWAFTGSLPVAVAASAYRQATSPPNKLPIILVEGYTDKMYFEWQLEGHDFAHLIEVRDCGSASAVAEQTIALRNQGLTCVAVLDSDSIGKQLRKQLSDFRHPVVSIPIEAVNLPKSAYDHVQPVAEIEDLLPVSLIEGFLFDHERQAELEIRAPTGVRYVIGKNDKRDLARWVVEETDRQAVPKLASILKEALHMLGLS